MSLVGVDGQVTVTDWYNSTGNWLERFETSDSMVLNHSGVEQLVSTMVQFAKPALGDAAFSAEMHEQLDPILAATWQAA